MSIEVNVLSKEAAIKAYDDTTSLWEFVIMENDCLELKDEDGSVLLIELGKGKLIINSFNPK